MMRSVAIIDETSREKLNEKYQDWQREHPKAIEVRINCTSVHLNTGSYPGEIRHFVFIFYKENPNQK